MARVTDRWHQTVTDADGHRVSAECTNYLLLSFVVPLLHLTVNYITYIQEARARRRFILRPTPLSVPIDSSQLEESSVDRRDVCAQVLS
jgi:hypothetical protein